MKDKTQACEEQWAKADLKINTQRQRVNWGME